MPRELVWSNCDELGRAMLVLQPHALDERGVGEALLRLLDGGADGKPARFAVVRRPVTFSSML